jgi:hypothetical protein
MTSCDRTTMRLWILVSVSATVTLGVALASASTTILGFA